MTVEEMNQTLTARATLLETLITDTEAMLRTEKDVGMQKIAMSFIYGLFLATAMLMKGPAAAHAVSDEFDRQLRGLEEPEEGEYDEPAIPATN